jgi:AcrR family transcriptional regulator
VIPSLEPTPEPEGLSALDRAEAERSRLMDTFTELVAERGYAALRVGEVVSRAGVSRAAFHEHFADKLPQQVEIDEAHGTADAAVDVLTGCVAPVMKLRLTPELSRFARPIAPVPKDVQ